MKKLIYIMLLCIQCTILISCASSKYYSESSSISKPISSLTNIESNSSSIIKNEDDNVHYTNEIVDDEYTGTYEPEKWILREEKPEESSEIWSGPVTLRELDESVIKNPITVSGEYSLPPITNDGNIQDLMSTVNEATVMAVLYNASYFSYRSIDAHPSNIQDYIVPIPVSFLRNTAPGCYYTVNKLVSGGYMYLFFERPYDEERIINESIIEYRTDDLTDVRLTGGVYMEKVLSKSDFSGIKVGDTIDDVIEVDNAAAIQKAKNDLEYLWSYTGAIKETYSVHLLKDGLLTILYELEGETLYVTDIIFNEEFTFYPPFLGNVYPKYYGILPQDYPPET